MTTVPEIWHYEGATLARVVDGDSFIANVERTFDMGFHVKVTGRAQQRFRIDGIACAERGTPGGDAAAEYVRSILGVRPFTLDSLGPYKFGDAWMARVILPGDGMYTGPEDLANILIDEQFAVPWTGRGPQPIPPWPRSIP